MAKTVVTWLLFLLMSCAAFGQKNKPFSKNTKVVYGVASFYSNNMEGTTTATGEAFHHNQLMAASNHFALNTWVRITNLKNGKSVIVRINDRMSQAVQRMGRVADMTREAAKQLDFLKKGLARVKVEEIKRL